MLPDGRSGRVVSAFAVALAIYVLFPACGREDEGMRPYPTWESEEEPLIPGIPPRSFETTIDRGEFPVAGIVSHHLLAHQWIEAWFAELAETRGVDTFIILSPRHWGQVGGVASLSLRDWAVGSGRVWVDKAMARRVAGRLGVGFDETAFFREHGVSALVPYIARYFPGAKIVPIAIDGEPPVDGKGARSLAGAIIPEFRAKQRERAFLIVSSDFSHHGTEEEARSRDRISRRFVESLSADEWFLAGCDNRPGMFALGRLADVCGLEGRILWRSCAAEIAPKRVDPVDVTSYFFSFAVFSGRAAWE